MALLYQTEKQKTKRKKNPNKNPPMYINTYNNIIYILFYLKETFSLGADF